MIKLISIAELLDKKFIIPNYQRGYRWTTRQVEDLLEDINEFIRKLHKQPGEFYCLQPLIVKKTKNENEYEVVDGQQRLTCIYLLLSELKDVQNILFSNENIYKITYNTRKNSLEYLEKLRNINFSNNNKEQSSTQHNNIDYYFMFETRKFINTWFNENLRKEKVNKGDFVNTLLRNDGNNVRFIWYEIEGEKIDGKAVYTRVNIGKIPLTNAELIKALFYINEKVEDRKKHQFARAYEWEYIEKSLQDDKFWYFLNGKENNTPTRIDFIFELIADKYKDNVSIKVEKKYDNYYSFYIFHYLISEKINIKNNNNSTQLNEDEIRELIWDEVKTYFRIFEEWYNNNEYYHLIGYLLHCNVSIKEIINDYESCTKDEFNGKLKEKIKENIKNIKIDENNNKPDISELDYYDDKEKIKKILLLFNVVLTMNSNYTRFPFDLFVKEKWSLEHIHAINSEDIKKDDLKRLINENLINHLNSLNDSGKFKELIDKINQYINKTDFTVEEIEDIKKLLVEINLIFTGDYENKVFNEENINNIGNLALLSRNINSALSNNIFPEKRRIIIEYDAIGKFVPIGTKYVFLKYFSQSSFSNHLLWTTDDMKNYVEFIKNTLSEFFNS